MSSAWLDTLALDRHYFVNAPGCRTRREAADYYKRIVLPAEQYAEQQPSNKTTEVIHEVFDPRFNFTVVDRRVGLLEPGADGIARAIVKSVRIGKSNLAAEKTKLELVREHTTLPIPVVFDYYTSQEFEHLTMEKMPGATLESVWSSLSRAEKQSIADATLGYIIQLRRLTHSRIHAALFDRKPLPLHVQTVTDLYMEKFKSFLLDERIVAFITDRCALLDDVPNVFTHGDLDFSNILVTGKQVSGIIDFELSGYFPKFWEWLQAKRIASRGHGWFQLLVDRFDRDRPRSWDGMWELEQLHSALTKYSGSALDPEGREENQSAGKAEVARILGADDIRLPPIKYDSSRSPFWLERVPVQKGDGVGAMETAKQEQIQTA